MNTLKNVEKRWITIFDMKEEVIMPENIKTIWSILQISLGRIKTPPPDINESIDTIALLMALDEFMKKKA